MLCIIRYVRRNVELDHATRIKFSPDGTYVILYIPVVKIVFQL